MTARETATTVLLTLDEALGLGRVFAEHWNISMPPWTCTPECTWSRRGTAEHWGIDAGTERPGHVPMWSTHGPHDGRKRPLTDAHA